MNCQEYNLSEIKKKSLQYALQALCSMVGPERIELSLPKEPDFESDASTNSATTPSTIKLNNLFIFIRQYFFCIIFIKMCLFFTFI